MEVQIHDIRGLDTISWWPPAPGWWIALGLTLVVLVSTYLLLRHYLRYPPGSWRNEAQKALRELRRNRHQQTPKETAAQLSELLRRIAIASQGRERTAALTGEQWLGWLQQADPNGFAWREQGGLLLKLPYAPEDAEERAAALESLIVAATRMVARPTRGRAADV
ncbi:MAG: DUF4381 domain-containing protein [Gammaproteobacteria bacterium]|nr:DUF4381 domain-containing protein [Gammaproteobacteria bacterium]